MRKLRWVFSDVELPGSANPDVQKLAIYKLSRKMNVFFDAKEDISSLGEVQNVLKDYYNLKQVSLEHMPVIEILPDAPKQEEKKTQYRKTATKKLDFGQIIYGKSMTQQFTPVSELTQELGLVACEGEIFSVEFRELKNEMKLVTFDITDFKDSICVKFFIRKIEDEDYNELQKEIKIGKKVAVEGIIAYDQYVKDITITANTVVKREKTFRIDTAEKKRVELHMHTQMSAMDATDGIGKIVETASLFGHKAIAVTDHGVVQAFPDAAKAGKKSGVKILYGVEGYLVDDSAQIVYGACEGDIESDFVVFDIETTGLSSEKNNITEIGAVRVKNGSVIDSWSTFVNPKEAIPSKIVELTGITDAMVKDAPTIDKVIKEFLNFCKDSVLVAHNANFDVGFIKKACERSNIEFDFTYLDTLQLARALYNSLPNHKLKTLAKHLNVSLEGHHRAVNDAKATADILIKMLDNVGEKGIHLLQDLNTKLTNNIDIKKYPAYHVILLAKNKTGLRNLYELISKSHMQYLYRTPRIPKSLLSSKREGIIIGSACEAGEVYQAVLNNSSEKKLEKLIEFYDYLEIQPTTNNSFMIAKGMISGYDELKEINRRIIELGKRYNKLTVATCDAHYINPESADYRRVLMFYKGFDDATNQPPLYLRTTDEMLDEFSYLGEDLAYEVVVENTNIIADMIEDLRPVPPDKCPPEIEGAEKDIVDASIAKAKSIYGDQLPEIIQQRLDKELYSITTYGFSVMYKIAQALVQKSINDGYLVGSRGSVGSSLVAFLAGITEVNSLPAHYVCPECKHNEFVNDGSGISGCDLPDKNCPKCSTKLNKDGHDIPFETFLGFEGDKEPDIDLNFSGEYQAIAHKYTEELFGEGHVFRAGTIGTVAEKTAYGYVKKYIEKTDLVLREAEKKRLALGCVDVKRTTGQHPGGIIVVPHKNDIHEFCPVQYPADKEASDTITTHFDYHSIDQNLLKLDILGHDDPTVIKMLQDLTGVDPCKIPLDDKDTMSLFTSTEKLGVTPEDIKSNVGTFGIPEFGTNFVRQMLEDTKPTTFAELVRISGLSHGTDVWLNNAQDLVRNGVAKLAEVICTRDDIMIYLISKGLDPKHSFTIMEQVRKGKRLKKDDEKAMRENNVPEWYIESCNKIQYMFPKAHAAAYVTMAFRIAYFKVHYAKEFYIAYYTVRADDFDAEFMTKGIQIAREKQKELEEKIKNKTISPKEEKLIPILEICIEMYCRGISFDEIDLYKSDATKFSPTETGILAPLNALAGLAENAAKAIVEARGNGNFYSKEDFKDRTGVSKTVIEVLEKNGCLSDMSDTNQMALF